MGGALLGFSATAVAIRSLSPVLDVFEMLALRNAMGLAILGLAALARPSLRAGLRAADCPSRSGATSFISAPPTPGRSA
jgi:hypothetical protein